MSLVRRDIVMPWPVDFLPCTSPLELQNLWWHVGCKGEQDIPEAIYPPFNKIVHVHGVP